MKKRRFVLGLMLAGVMAGGSLVVASPASAGGPWAPIKCVDTNNDGIYEVPQYVIDSGYSNYGPCTNTGPPPENNTYNAYYVSCIPKKDKTQSHTGILWQRGTALSFQCVGVPD